jgi:hypothetical protein
MTNNLNSSKNKNSFLNGNNCFSCLKKLDGDCNLQKICHGCDQEYCLDCIALTAYQTTMGYCRLCYNYKCKLCNRKLTQPYQNLYLEDGLYSTLPICHLCSKSKNKSNLSKNYGSISLNLN